MTKTFDPDGRWRGTSDSRAALLARSLSTPQQRLAWLDESLLLAQASGALARDRAARQRAADAWGIIPAVDAILLDIDGTLVDSTPAVERIWSTWAEQRGLDADAILAVAHGRRVEDTLARFVPAEQIPPAVADLERLELADLSDVIALPGALALLATLPAERWAAVTSGSRRLMRARLTASALPVPEVLVAAEDVTVGKPDPSGYRQAAERLGVDIARCLVIEDSPAGVAAGRTAGASVLGVLTSHRAAELGEAHQIVPDLTALRVESGADGLVIRLAG